LRQNKSLAQKVSTIRSDDIENYAGEKNETSVELQAKLIRKIKEKQEPVK